MSLPTSDSFCLIQSHMTWQTQIKESWDRQSMAYFVQIMLWNYLNWLNLSNIFHQPIALSFKNTFLVYKTGVPGKLGQVPTLSADDRLKRIRINDQVWQTGMMYIYWGCYVIVTSLPGTLFYTLRLKTSSSDINIQWLGVVIMTKSS